MIKLLRISFLHYALVFSALLSFCVSDASAQAREKLVNGSERETVAIGHFARARALLIEALAEFEKGKTISDPSLIIDTERWRGSIVLRAEELNRVVAPKPRITRQGISYEANSQLTGFDKPSAQKPLIYKPKAESAPKPVPAKAPVVEQKTAPISAVTAQPEAPQQIETTENPVDVLAPEENKNVADDEAKKQLADEIANINMDSDSDFGSDTAPSQPEKTKITTEDITDTVKADSTADSSGLQDGLQDADIDLEVEKIIQESLGNSNN